MSSRLLNPADLPEQLWLRAEGLVLVPPALAEAYTAQINALGLRGLSEMRDPDDPPVGGITQEQTDRHFAQAFDSSVARVELVILDPLSDLGEASDSILRAFAGDRIVLADAPCGAGAAALSLLCCIAELRRQGIVTRHPLDVTLIGAEISDPARLYAEQMVDRVSRSLADQGIFVRHECMPWDVLSEISNTDLIQHIVRAGIDGRPCCLVIANFSGFLQRARKRAEAEPKLGELFRHVSRGGGSTFWVEPATNVAAMPGGLLPWFSGRVRSVWRHLFAGASESNATEDPSVSHAQYRRVLSPTETPRVNVALIRSEFRGR